MTFAANLIELVKVVRLAEERVRTMEFEMHRDFANKVKKDVEDFLNCHYNLLEEEIQAMSQVATVINGLLAETADLKAMNKSLTDANTEKDQTISDLNAKLAAAVQPSPLDAADQTAVADGQAELDAFKPA